MIGLVVALALATDDPQALCRQRVDAGKLDDAIACLRADPEDKQAQAMADVVEAWQAAQAKKKDEKPKLSWGALVDSGGAEGIVQGAALGAAGGFLLASTWFATTRTNEQDSLPWLIASPALGAIGGAAGSFALIENVHPTAGDIALTTSTTWAGLAQGFMLQLAVFDQDKDVSAVPLRFATVLGGGVLGLGVGLGLSPVLDVTQGDAAVANSAMLWGGVMTGFGLALYASTNPATPLTLAQTSLLMSAGSLAPYAIVLACHPWLTIERWPSWLIEAGGAAGFLIASSAITGLALTGGTNGTVALAAVGTGTAAGVVVGAGAAWLVSTQMQAHEPASPSHASPGGALAPDDANAHPHVSTSLHVDVAPTFVVGDHGAAPGVAVVGTF